MNSLNNQGPTREPSAAGTFYPSDSAQLSNEVVQLLQQDDAPKVEGTIRVLIAPHAGYSYSGVVAGYGYQALQLNLGAKAEARKTVVLIGPSHHYPISGIVMDSSDVWRTPLGHTALDTQLRNRLAGQSSLFRIEAAPHRPEHSLEVQVPFLQKILADFEILPLLVNELNNQELEQAVKLLAAEADDNTIIIASSDLSHYPDFNDARRVDNQVIKAVLTGSSKEFRLAVSKVEQEAVSNLVTCACGQAAVELVMETARRLGTSHIRMLKYANSGDVSGADRSYVVGYASIVFAASGAQDKLGYKAGKELLEIARRTVESYISQNRIPEFKIKSLSLWRKQGAFVTIKKHGRLRGCIGTFESSLPLWQTVSRMAVCAAVEDKRFQPVQADELPELKYEISVLSPLRRVRSWRDIKIGKHGVQIRKDGRSGVFLPQVALENNWGLEEFMSVLCAQKAGLPADCWKNPDTELYIFTVQVF